MMHPSTQTDEVVAGNSHNLAIRLTDSDYKNLTQAAYNLENPSLAAKISHMVGIPVEKALSSLPEQWSKIAANAAQSALNKALDSALLTLSNQHTHKSPSNHTHKLLAGVSGAVGGTFGITTLAVELPLSATIILRSIADIARSQGEDLDQLETKLACMEVFALGGKSPDDDAADTGYYAVRSFLAKSLGDTAKHIASKGLSKEGAPVLVQFINAVANRFSIPVSQKIAAQTVPILGALGGATTNLIFINHFQTIAEAHFTVRQLERTYGREVVENIYASIVKSVA